MFETIIRERRRREVQPILETIEKCLTMIDQAPATDGQDDGDTMANQRARFADILDFFETMNSIVNVALEATPGGLKGLAQTLRSL